MKKIKFTAFVLSIIVIALTLYYFSRPQFAKKHYPKLKEYSLMRPIGVNDDSEDLMVYYINYLYKYDSLDLAILKPILESYSVDFKITRENEAGHKQYSQ